MKGRFHVCHIKIWVLYFSFHSFYCGTVTNKHCPVLYQIYLLIYTEANLLRANLLKGKEISFLMLKNHQNIQKVFSINKSVQISLSIFKSNSKIVLKSFSLEISGTNGRLKNNSPPLEGLLLKPLQNFETNLCYE